MSKKQKIVLLQGAFDIFNAGHAKAIKRARGLGDFLIIALNTDSLYKKYKGRGDGAYVPYRERKIILEANKWIDLVIPAHSFSPLSLLKKHKVDVYVLTKEWEKTKAVEIEYILKKGGKISFSPRYKIQCSSAIRQRVINRHIKRRRDRK